MHHLPPIGEVPERHRVGLVLVRAELDRAARRDHARRELPHALSRGLGIGPAEARFASLPVAALARPHRSAPSQLRVLEAVDEVALGAHE